MLLTKEEITRLELKISAAEKLTSAEFKIIIAKRAWYGVRKKATRLFKKHKLDQTKDRNTVLLLLLESDRQLVIYGDIGINNKVEFGQWTLVRDEVLNHLKDGKLGEGLDIGLHLIVNILKEHFPGNIYKENEVSNEIIFEK